MKQHIVDLISMGFLETRYVVLELLNLCFQVVLLLDRALQIGLPNNCVIFWFPGGKQNCVIFWISAGADPPVHCRAFSSRTRHSFDPSWKKKSKEGLIAIPPILELLEAAPLTSLIFPSISSIVFSLRSISSFD